MYRFLHREIQQTLPRSHLPVSKPVHQARQEPGLLSVLRETPTKLRPLITCKSMREGIGEMKPPRLTVQSERVRAATDRNKPRTPAQNQ